MRRAGGLSAGEAEQARHGGLRRLVRQSDAPSGSGRGGLAKPRETTCRALVLQPAGLLRRRAPGRRGGGRGAGSGQPEWRARGMPQRLSGSDSAGGGAGVPRHRGDGAPYDRRCRFPNCSTGRTPCARRWQATFRQEQRAQQAIGRAGGHRQAAAGGYAVATIEPGELWTARRRLQELLLRRTILGSTGLRP